MKKWQGVYRVTVYTNENTIIVKSPLTAQINITRSIMSESTKATIKLYNLAPSTRNGIFQDVFTFDYRQWKYVHVEAGYGNEESMSMIFKGRILQAYSHKSGGQTDVITEIQAMALDVFDCQTSLTVEAGTSKREAIQQILNDTPNITLGNMGAIDGTFKTATTFDGNSLNCINEIAGGRAFIDNGVLNVLLENEVIDVPVPVITDDTALLETPIRRDANLTVKMLFQPDLIIGQLLEIKSNISPNFNGQFKVMGFTHDLTFGDGMSGTRTTTADLWILPLLPGADRLLTDSGTVTGGAIPITGAYKVKGTDVIPADAIIPNNIQDVYRYIQKNGKAPHIKVTNNIWWDEIVKYPSLGYGKPTIKELTNLAYCCYRIQAFKDKYYQGARIQLNSGWRSRGYNNTLSNADPNSEHLYGNAIDFALVGHNINTVYSVFKNYWKGRTYLHKAWGFIHADTTISRGRYANDW